MSGTSTSARATLRAMKSKLYADGPKDQWAQDHGVEETTGKACLRGLLPHEGGEHDTHYGLPSVECCMHVLPAAEHSYLFMRGERAVCCVKQATELSAEDVAVLHELSLHYGFEVEMSVRMAWQSATPIAHVEIWAAGADRSGRESE